MGLFEHLLGRPSPAESEAAYWIDYLSERRDPVDIFFKFVTSEEYRTRSRANSVTQTAYPAGHFYSPVVNVDEVQADAERIFAPRSLSGIDLRLDQQEALFKRLSAHFGSMPFSEEPNERNRYHFENSSYGFGDACIYWSMLGLLRPGRVLEIGSGFTSALALDAIDHFGLPTRCTFVDPNPGLLLQVTKPRNPRHSVIARPVQAVGAALVSGLSAGDLLFIDSSHVVKTGSDVLHELTEMLPRLPRGTLVHFHDVFYPFEYPRDWVLSDNKSWNELYFLHAFLMFNSDFEVLYFNDCFAKVRRSVVNSYAGASAPRILLNPGGGLWLRRV